MIIDPKSQLKSLSNEAQGIVNILVGDLQKVIDISNEKIKALKGRPVSIFLNEQETWFRLANRLVITTIESICYSMKQTAYLVCQQRKLPLSSEKQELINEKKADGSPRYQKTHENLKFSFELLAYAFGTKSPLKFNKKWAIFLRTVKKRNELTHPKVLKDLKISAKQHKESAETLDWFEDLIKELLDEPISR